MMDSYRRTILTTGAAVAATAAVPQVFAQQGGQEGGSFYEKAMSASVTMKSVPAFRCWLPRATA